MVVCTGTLVIIKIIYIHVYILIYIHYIILLFYNTFVPEKIYSVTNGISRARYIDHSAYVPTMPLPD